MNLWIDAQLPPGMCGWLASDYSLTATHLRDTPWAVAPDHTIFQSLRSAGNVIVSKDEDFVDLVTRLDPPPQLLWVRLGNVTNRALRLAMSQSLERAIELLRAGVAVVEIGGRE